jgi:geranylgeranyl diphosphate synthase type I
MGQFLDLAYEGVPQITQEQYLTMIHGKTAHLLAAATASGAQIAQANPDKCEAFFRFGEQLGMAFQILDDILGIKGKPETTGKPSGDDLIARKKTMPILYGIEESSTFKELWHTNKTDKDTIQTMTAELTTCGAIKYANSKVEEYSQSALKALNLTLPSPRGEKLLEALTLDLMRRDL